MKTSPARVREALRDVYRGVTVPLDVTEVRRVATATYFLTYALLLVVTATRSTINDAARSLPAAVRPPPLLPIEAAVGLPRSVSMGLVSLATAVAAVALLAGHALAREPDGAAVPVDDRDGSPAGRNEPLSAAGPTLGDVQFPRLADVDHPFEHGDEERDDVPSLEEVFRHGGPGARLRPDWGRGESGVRTPRLRVDSVRVPPRTDEDATDEDDEREDDADGERWPGDWHTP